jgi:hypothetical protein
MSNQRETILAAIVTLLEGIRVPTFNTQPYVSRKREHWVDTNRFPILFVDEGEPEEVINFAFGMMQGILNIQILGRIQGSWEELNELIEDIRKRLDSADNTYRKYSDLITVQAVADPSSDLKEFECRVNVDYYYNRGSA